MSTKTEKKSNWLIGNDDCGGGFVLITDMTRADAIKDYIMNEGRVNEEDFEFSILEVPDLAKIMTLRQVFDKSPRYEVVNVH